DVEGQAAAEAEAQEADPVAVDALEAAQLGQGRQAVAGRGLPVDALGQGHAGLEPALGSGPLDDGYAVGVDLGPCGVNVRGAAPRVPTLALAQPGVKLGREHGIPLVGERGAPALDVAADPEDLLQDHEARGRA